MIRGWLLALMLAIAQAPAWGQSIAAQVDYLSPPHALHVTGLMARHINGLLTLQLAVSNQISGDQTGYYRVDWVDEAGFSVWPDEAWKPVLLHGGQTLRWLVVAPTAAARDFKIEFTEASSSAP